MFSYKHLSNMSPFAIYLLSFLVYSTIAHPTNTKNAEDPEIQYLPFYKGEVKYDDNLDWRVVGGSPATGPSQFPYMVSLRRASHFCGGSIISNNWILTAAHCTIGSAPTSISAVVGTATLNAGGDSYQISVIITHPDYSSSTISNDVSVIRTALNIAFGVNVQSIPIGTSYVDGGIQAILSGWGRTVTGGALPNQLQWLVVETVSVASCQQALSPNPVFESSLCTFTRAGQGACNGDSGGPLAVNGVVVALVSWGIPCARGYPDVFARVSSFSSWIIQNAVN